MMIKDAKHMVKSPKQKTYKITSECHLIPVPSTDNKVFLAYFPLKSLVFKINSTAADLITMSKMTQIEPKNEDERKIFDSLVGMGVMNGQSDRIPDPPRKKSPVPNRALLLLSDRCNQRCVYCYGSAAETGGLMSFEIAKAAVDTVVQNAVSEKKTCADIGFHGGGEPTINWEVLTQVMEYAKLRCKKSGIRLQSSICTNGQLPKERVSWLADNIVTITISMDGPPDIQNRQRPLENGGPSYDGVAATIDELDRLGKPYIFRVTITEFSESRMVEVYSHLTSRFHPRVVCIEPLFVCGRCATTQCKPPEANAFINGFKEISRLSRKPGISVQYSGGRIFMLDSCFCGASRDNFFITSRGEVTSCVEVSTREDPRSEIFIYGDLDISTGKFNYDIEKYQNLIGLRVQEFSSCESCFARWHCSGDCLTKAPDMKQLFTSRNPYRCEINKEITRHQLMMEIDSVNKVTPSVKVINNAKNIFLNN
jgi:uncharacterized protein